MPASSRPTRPGDHNPTEGRGEDDERVQIAAENSDELIAVPPSALRNGIIFNISHAAVTSSFARYCVLYFISLGMSATQVGVAAFVSKAAAAIVSPIVGALADRTGKARQILIAALCCQCIPFFSLLVLPSIAVENRFMVLMPIWVVFSAISTFNAFAGLREALILALLNGRKDLWGRCKLAGAASWGICHGAMGGLLDLVGNFHPMFIQLAVTVVATLCVVRGLPESCGELRRPVDIWDLLRVLTKNIKVIAFFTNITLLGASFMLVENLLFVFLSELDASYFLLGLSVMVTVVFELPVFYYAGRLLKRVGINRMIMIGQFAWIVRAFYYTVMPGPWWVLGIEPLHGVTYASVLTAGTAAMTSPAIAEPGMEASCQNLFNSLFLNVGAMAGVLVGGWMFDWVGSDATFRIFCVMNAVSMFLLWLVGPPDFDEGVSVEHVGGGVQGGEIELEIQDDALARVDEVEHDKSPLRSIVIGYQQELMDS